MFRFTIKQKTDAEITNKTRTIVKHAQSKALMFLGCSIIFLLLAWVQDIAAIWCLFGFQFGAFAASADTRYLAEYIRRQQHEQP